MTLSSTEDEEGLRVCELFVSLAGETSWAGLPATFIRLGGCNLRCSWCDTPRAQTGGVPMPLDWVVGRVAEAYPQLVVVTGGEPLLQSATPELCRALLARGKTVLLETNGSLDVSIVPQGVHVICDLKPPSSGCAERNDLDNLRRLHAGDELKIVIADRADFDWALETLEARPPGEGVGVLLSPVWGGVDPGVLGRWLLDSRQNARLQLQLHRLLWPDGSDGFPLNSLTPQGNPG